MKKRLFITIIAFLLLFSTAISETVDFNTTVEKMEISEYYWYLSLLTDAHVEIAMWEVDNKSMFFSISVLSQMKYYSNLDVLDYLWFVFDIRKSFDSLLYEMSAVLEKSEVLISNIKNNLLFLKTKKEDCDLQKTIVDKNFSLALKDLDIKNMEINLNKSLEYDNCSSESRLLYNAQNKILDEFDYYYTILEYKYNYYYSNKFEIVENYPNILYNLKK